MSGTASFLLIGAVAAVGVLHTIVPDHWVPITILARQQGWTRRQIIRAAAVAGGGHVTSTLLIAVLVWAIGATVAVRFGNAVSTASSMALITFGAWIAISSLREMRKHGHSHFSHAHQHRHTDGTEHPHYHEHHGTDWHAIDSALALAAAPIHEHAHNISSRAALLLILGSSPMVEGIPAFFAAAKYGIAQLVIMAVVFAASTIATYIASCLLGASGLERLHFGVFERYGEVLSGTLIALLGVVFFFVA